MGRHHIKLPEHLYISPPPPPQSPSAFLSASSFFSSKSRFPYSPAGVFLQTTATTRAFERRIPGFNTSAAFLTALRDNLDLQTDELDSPADTPDCLRPTILSSSTLVLPPPSPLIHAMSNPTIYSDADLAPPSALPTLQPSTVDPEPEVAPQEPQDPNAIPELSTFPANTDNLRIEALRLIADSVAQQRQRANRALIFHPFTIGLLAVAFALLRQYLKGDTGEWGDWTIVGTTFFGILMTVLVSIRSFTGTYIEEAENVGTWKWLAQGRSLDAEKQSGMKVLGDREDEILLTKFGNEYIGAIIFRGVQSMDDTLSTTSKKAYRKSNVNSQPKTEIRGWSVKRRFRGKGVGTALLDDAIKLADSKGWTQGGIEPAKDHANNKVVLPTLFSGFVQANDKRTRQYVQKKVDEFQSNSSGKGRKKR